MAEWVAAKAGVNGGLPWMRAWWFPIKDSNNTHVKTPIPISKRSSAVTGTDPACPYDAIRTWFEIRSAQVPRSEWKHHPFFLHPHTGKIPTTKYVGGIAKRMAKLLGIAEENVGGKSWRIAGATDLYDEYGEHARRILKERGRWFTDVAYIYARVSEAAHLEASQRMSRSTGADLESSAPGWSQSARR